MPGASAALNEAPPAVEAAPAIRWVSFRNFKSLRQVEMTLERFTVLVGANASGKSSVLQGLDYLCLAGRDTSSKRVEEEAPFLYSRGGSGDLEVECVGDQGGLRLRIAPPAELAEELPGTDPIPSGSWQVSVEHKVPGESGQWAPIKTASKNHRSTPSAVMLQLEPARLAEPHYSESVSPSMSSNGTGLHSMLAHLALNQPDAFQQLQAHLHQIVPAIRRIRFTRAPVVRTNAEPDTVPVTYAKHRYVGDALLFDVEGATWVPARLASEGTLLLLGLLAVLHGSARPDVVLVDDIDRGLHPKAQLELVTLLRRLLESNPKLQLIATTHSPYLLDKLRPEEVRLTALREDGSTACACLKDHPRFEQWKDEMTPGEFWSLIGEKWVSEPTVGVK